MRKHKYLLIYFLLFTVSITRYHVISLHNSRSILPNSPFLR